MSFSCRFVPYTLGGLKIEQRERFVAWLTWTEPILLEAAIESFVKTF